MNEIIMAKTVKINDIDYIVIHPQLAQAILDMNQKAEEIKVVCKEVLDLCSPKDKS